MASHASADVSAQAPRWAAAALLLTGSAVAVACGVYARAHDPAGRPMFMLGFSGMLQMKAWLTTIAAGLIVVQLLSALRMFGRIGSGPASSTVALLHRWSGTAAFLVLLPAAFHCMWSLGFGTGSTRVVAHSIIGCLVFGAYAAKLPVLGGTVLTSVVLLWLTASLWFFTRSGIPLT
jgi:hypothetical protein